MRKRIALLFKIFLTIILISTVYYFRDPILIWLGHEWYGWVATRPPRAGAEVRGTIETKTFHSDLLGMDRSVSVYLPYNYNQVFFSHFPVLYLLHGFAGVKEDWVINAKITDVVEKLISEGKLPPLILVMPDGNGPLMKDSEYVDATLIKQPIESHIVSEVVPYIDANYRTVAEGKGRAILGISTGAYGAVNITLHHPDVFHYAVSLGGYFINHEWPMDKLTGVGTEARAANEPLKYIDKFETEEPLKLYLAYSETDYKEFIADNLQFDAKLTTKNIDHTLVKMPGGHFWGPWNKQMPDALTWLGGIFRDEL